MVKELRRQDITFEMKDQPLRDDVRILGTLVGDLLRDQGGAALFEIVENARLQKQFGDLVTELLAEPPDLIESLTGAGTDENN